MRHTLREIANHIGAELAGDDASVEISGVASLGTAAGKHLVFIEDAKLLAQALASKAGAIIVPVSVEVNGAAKPLLRAKSPRLAFARAAALLAEPPEHQLGVHPSAVVHKDAKLGLGVSVGPHAVVQRAANIGARSRVGANASIGAGVSLGSQCEIAPNVTIYSGTKLGDRVVVHAGVVLGSDGFGFVRDEQGKYEKFPQIGTLVIGNDVEIGANCTIDRGALESTVIGNGTKLDNQVHIGHNVRIGDNVVIAAQTGISGSTVIGNNVIVGGQVGIGDHVIIEDGVILGSGSGVLTGKIVRGAGVVHWGIPAKPLKQHLKELATISRLAQKSSDKKQKD
ncbi:MAG TPA: UDP-3-O-(3-hydroxymyristoyl)glucosamine N-acyltransferase [Terriglobales bacterium]|nr:UDP-3-O-(3-hydroxymyristoyl)glucosamine N-acyltransferase [Terriglobales bacterium]